MPPDMKKPADQAIGRGNALPEETADLPSKGRLKPGAAAETRDCKGCRRRQ